MAHQKGVTVPRFVDSSFSVASFNVLEAPLQRSVHHGQRRGTRTTLPRAVCRAGYRCSSLSGPSFGAQ